MIYQIFFGYLMLNSAFIWLGWVLWHINHCRSFNVKSSSHIFIKHIYIFSLAGFYGISTIFDYLKSSPV